MSLGVQILLGIPWFIGFAWAARRLLGVRRLSATRTLAAAAVGIAVGNSVTPALIDQDVPEDAAVWTGIALSGLATMAAIVVFAALTRPDQPPRQPGVPRPIRYLTRRIDRARRSFEVTRIAAHHGLGSGFGLISPPASTAEAAARGADLRAALEEAGGLFVKLGQLLANRPDIIPPAIAAELEQLQQDVTPAPRSDMQPAIEAALGAPIGAVFAEFDWEPIGAASIGQVYRATLTSGESVVLKARRPDVQDRIDRDLQIVLDLAETVEKYSDQAQRFGVTGIADEFAELLRNELDYRFEADNTIEAQRAVTSIDNIVVPKIFEQHTTDSTLVLELVTGEPLGRHGVVGGDHGRALADELFTFEVNAMLSGDLFHADPHPGNILIRPDGTLGLIDFGSVGRLDSYERDAISSILTAIELRDPSMMRAAALQVGMGDAIPDPDRLDRAFARMMADHLTTGETPSPEVLIEFMAIAQRFDLRMPAGVSEMVRAVGTLQGSLELLSPNYPIIDAARSVATDRMGSALNPDALADTARSELIRLAPMLRKLPHRIDHITNQLEHGRLGVQVSLLSQDTDVRVLTQIANRALTTVIAATIGVMSALLFQIEGPPLSDNVDLIDVLASLGLLLSTTLLLRVLVEILRE